MTSDRAVSPVVGYVLLLGLVAIGGIGLYGVSMAVYDDTTSSIQQDQTESALSQTARDIGDVAVGESQATELASDNLADLNPRADPDAGTINITLYQEDEGKENVTLLDDTPMGMIEYEMDDGTTYAYQGGGIWRQGPTGHTTMVQAPDFEYRAGPRDEPTLTFSVSRITGDDHSGPGSLTLDEQVRHHPVPGEDLTNPMGNGTVEIAIESDYCEAWQDFFMQRTSGAVTERCDEDVKGPNVVQLQLEVPDELLDGIGHGVIVPGDDDVHEAGTEVEGEKGHGDMPSISDDVENKVDGADFTAAEDIEEPGTYTFTSIEETINIDVNPEEEEEIVEVIVEDEVDLDGDDISVSGSADVNIFINEGGSLAIDDGYIGNPEDPSQTSIYVHSDAEDDAVDVGPGGAIYGVVYAPSSVVDINGNDAKVEGAVIAEEITLRGNPSGIIYDDAIEDKTLETVIGDADQRIYYLHVLETKLEVRD